MAIETNPVKKVKNLDFTTSLSTALPLTSASLEIASGNSTTAGVTDKTLLVMEITALPKDGLLKKQNTVLRTGDKITQADINAGIISYTHDPAKLNIKDTFTVCADENDATGVRISRTRVCFAININISIPEVPPVGAFNGIKLVQDTEKVFGPSNFNYNDDNNPGQYSQIFFEIQTPPTKGTLYLDGKPLIASGDRFTQEDINNGKVKYVNQNTPKDPRAKADSFTFKPTDPQKQYGALQTFPIEIELIILKPVLTVTKLDVQQNSEQQVNANTALNLKAQDGDTVAADLKFTVKTLPTQGDMLLNGVALKAGDTFTQADVDGGKLKYKHKGGETVDDSFAVSVTDGTTTVEGTMPIKILIPVNLPPKVEITDIMVDQGGTAPIGTAIIKITDPEALPEASIKMKIINLPRYGTLKLNGVAMTLGQEFTYADVVAGTRWTHTHDNSTNLVDVLKVSVTDGKNVAEYPINIRVKKKVNKPPKLDVNTPITIASGATTTVAKAVLSFSDEDSPSTEVKLTITALPTHGTATVAGRPLVVGAVVTLEQWNTAVGSITYVNTKTDPSTVDAILFKLSDEENNVGPFTFTINITQVPPKKTPGLINKGMNVLTKSSTVIREEMLSAKDEDTVDAKLVFKLTSVPAKGKLKMGGQDLRETDTFTVADIKALRLSYVEEDITATTDSFNFTLSDDADPPFVLTGTFTISIDPGFGIVVSTEITVNNGANVTPNPALTGIISGKELNATSLRWEFGQRDRIVWTVTTKPLWGSLMIGTNSVNSFNKKDILENILIYKHAGNSEEPTDYFDYTVTDGTETRTGRFKINIVAPPDPVPVLTNTGMDTTEQSCKAITTTNLFATDRDAIGNPVDRKNLVFVIKGAISPPAVRMTKGTTELAVNSQFTADDLFSGTISVCIGAGQSTVRIPMVLMESGNEFNTFDFEVRVKALPPTTSVNLGMATSACFDQGLTSYIMRVDNPPPGIAPKDVVFTLTSVPLRGTLKKAGTDLAVGGTYTQADIAAGIVVYSHKSTETGVDFFTYTWRAGDKTGQERFLIDVQYVNNPPWLGELNGITVLEKTVTVLTKENLMIYDVDLDLNGTPSIPPDLNTVTWTDRGNTVGGFTQVFNVKGGDTYNYNLQVNKGSVRFLIADANSRTIVDTGCTLTNKTGTFTIPPDIEDAKVIVSTGCAVGQRDTSYVLSLSKN